MKTEFRWKVGDKKKIEHTFTAEDINTFSKLIFSVSFIYVLGLIWLGTLIGWDKPIFELGAQPFLLAELFKMLLLLFLTPTLLKAKKLIKIT